EPKVDTVFVGNKTISGDIITGQGQRKRKNLTFTITVTVNRKAGGTEEKTLSIPPTERKTKWSVTLGSALAEGDKVTVTEVGETSKTKIIEVKPSLKDQHKDDLQMPTGKIWIEQTSSNQVNDDEQAEAIQMLKDANPDIVKYIDFDSKKTKFSIDGTGHAYYEVTYTDGSTAGKIEATGLKIKQVEETSAAPTIQKVQVTDGQIIVTLAKEVAAGTKFYFISNFTDGEEKNFSEGGSCKIDKSTSKEMSQAVSVDGTKVTFPINDRVNDLKLRKEFGIAVKEPHKFRSCAKSEPVVTTPDKVAVRDPHKLTDDDKKAIDKAIRDANTVNGVSNKLPDGTGTDVGGAPTIIDFDKDGNVTIISPNDVVVDDWDSNGNPIYTRNPDGTYKLKDGAKVTKFDAKDLVKNIKPESPAIAVDTDKGEVTITPPAYKDPGDDTDLLSYTFTYNDASGAKQTGKVTRTVDGDGKTTWSSDGATVDANSGKVTLQIKDLAVAAKITATAKDNGGLIPEEKPLESDPAEVTLEKVKVTYNANQGSGAMQGKELNKGQKYTLAANDFKAPDENQEFKAWEVNGQEVAPGTEITVKDNTVVKAVWKKIQVKVSYDGNGGKGTMEGKTLNKGESYKLLASTFTAPENQEFKTWEIDGKEVAAGTEIIVDKDTKVKAIWKDSMVDVSFEPGEGSGTMDKKTVKKGSAFKLPSSEFKAPENKELKGWKIGEKEYQVGEEITVKDDTTVTAIWKDVEYKVNFDGNGGTGKMEEKTAKKGEAFKLPSNGFTTPAGKEFSGWEVNRQTHKVGDSITVTGDVTVKALWKDKPAPSTTTPGKDKPGNQVKPQPKPQTQNPAATEKLTKTGANGMYSLYASLLLLATGGLFVISRRRRNQR
ncbi:MAG: InlB B-repeat-containing protein, partial [Varibaculum cambriense]|nr:InlB B-repeat-containing protein [Varibaculum cambriense]